MTPAKRQDPAAPIVQDSGGTPSVLDLIRGIRAGTIPLGNLNADSRRACVEHLSGEGYSSSEIAAVLHVTDRTIRRDREAIRAAHAVQRDPRLLEEMVGRLVQRAELSAEHIGRAVRGKDAKPMDRVAAELALWKITKELIESLQRLGYLPSAAVQVQGTVTHGFTAALPPIEDLQVEVERLEAIGERRGASRERLARIGQVKQTLHLLVVAKTAETAGHETGKEKTDEPQAEA